MKNIISNINLGQIIPIISAIGIILIFRILSSFLSSCIIKILRANKKEKKDIKKNPFYLPLKTIFTFIGIYIGINILKETIGIDAMAQGIISKVIKIALILFVAKAFGVGLDNENGLITKIKNKKGKELDKSTTSIILKTIKAIIYIVAGFMVISELGYDLTGLVTSLGIGGVVITLAAQDTAKSLIGGIAIFFDKPFKVGDYIKVGTYEGTVEEIKFRNTNIRTIDNSVLHIPNSEMSISAIINYSEMERRRYYTKLILELDTSLIKVENTKSRIQQMLENKETVIKDTISVKFQDISDNGIDIVVIAYINEINYSKYLDIKEQINYEIMAILQDEGVELAYNTQTIYVKKQLSFHKKDIYKMYNET